MARRRRNHNFKIHVDPSCLSDTMDDEPTTQKVGDDSAQQNADTESDVETTHNDIPVAEHDQGDISEAPELEDELDEDEAAEASALSQPDIDGETSQLISELEASVLGESEHIDTSMSLQDETSMEHERSRLDNDISASAADYSELPLDEESAPEQTEEVNAADDTQAPGADVSDYAITEAEASLMESVHAADTSAPTLEQQETDLPTDTSTGLRASIEHDDPEPVTKESSASRESSSRRTSQRSEAQFEEGDSILSTHTDPDNHDESFANDSEMDHNESHAHVSRGGSRSSSRRDYASESNSQHGATDEEVFSDKSPRSSVGSYDAESESGKVAYTEDRTRARSPRMSDMSQYDRDEFTPTTRNTPRPPFRTPSDVHAMQMSSPTASVYGGSPRSSRSPRSAKRAHPTVSRLGTPTQYSPKKGSTPPRFKPIKEAPLVLLHATVVPLHWAWGELVNSLDSSDLSDATKGLRDSWRVLQDRIGDTVVERGILLGHPQDDYELLEERLLEALDLPLRRRARILECGHYLGPSNESSISESEDSEDDFAFDRRRSTNKRHWCGTCKHEIRLEELGAGRVFRVKVYASNGLMRAGAWAACWKEMERVDVEIEPIVEPAVQDELIRLAALQEERMFSAREEQDIAREVALRYEEERAAEQEAALKSRAIEYYPLQQEPIAEAAIPKVDHSQTPDPARPAASPMPEESPESSPHPKESTHSMPSAMPNSPEEDKTKSQAPQNDYVPPPSPRSPSEGVQEHQDNLRSQYQGATLPQLLLEALKVLLQDRKNLAIISLSVIVVVFALRAAPKDPGVQQVVYESMQSAPELHQPVTADRQDVVEQMLSTLEAQAAVALPSSAQVDKASSAAFGLEAMKPAASVENSASQEASTATSQQALPRMIEAPQNPLGAAEKVSQPLNGLAIIGGTSPAAADAPEQEVIKVYQTITETQTEVETRVETILVYATENFPQAEPTPKRLEIEG